MFAIHIQSTTLEIKTCSEELKSRKSTAEQDINSFNNEDIDACLVNWKDDRLNAAKKRRKEVRNL